MKQFMFIVLLLISSLLFAQNYVQVGSGEVDTPLPSYTASWNYAWTSAIYSAEEIGQSMTITSLAFDQNRNYDWTQTSQKIYLKMTTDSEFDRVNDSYFSFPYEDPENNGYTLVYDGSIDWTLGWVNIDIDDFEYDSSQNLIVHWENYSGSTTFSCHYNATNVTTDVIKTAGSDDAFPSTALGGTPYPNAKPNLRLYYESDAPANPQLVYPENNSVAISLNPEFQFTLSGADTYDFYFGNNTDAMEIIADDVTAIEGINTYTLESALVAGETYYWKVSSSNSNGETFSETWGFQTEVVITEFPYFEGFEGDFPPYGWQNIESSWSHYWMGYEGTGSAKIGYSHTGDAVLELPSFTLESNARVSFYWLDADAIDATRIANHDTTYFEVSVDNGVNWNALAYLSAPSVMSEFELEEIDLFDYANQTVRFRFRDVSDGSFSAYGTIVDNFQIEILEPAPIIQISQEELIFPSIMNGSQSSMTVEILNNGISNLVITGTNVTGPFTCDYSGTISPAETVTATINYNPTTSGNDSGQVTFEIDGTFEGVNSVTLSGTSYAGLTTLFENFDQSTEMPENWTQIEITEQTTDPIFVHSAEFDAHSGTNFVKMYMADTTTNDNIILVTPGLENLASKPLQFYSKSSWGDVDNKIIVGTLSDPYDYTTFTEVQTFDLTAEYQQFVVNFSEDNTDSYIGFKHGATSENGYAVYLDDISWEVNDVVPNPAVEIYPVNLAQDVRISFNENKLLQPLEWSANGGNPTQYQISIGTDNPPTNIYSGTVTEASLELTQPLEYDTQYYWQVIPENENGPAENCPVWSFVTMSDPSFIVDNNNPFEEGFETTEVGYIPTGWEMDNLNDDSAIWSVLNNSDTQTNAHTGEKAVHIAFSFVTDNNDWLYSKPLVLTAGNTYQISFWYAVKIFQESHEALEVAIGNEMNPEAMTNRFFFDDNLTNTDYMQCEYNFVPETSGVYFIGFHSISPSLQFVTLIDDVSVEEIITGNENDSTSPNYEVTNYPNPFNPTTTISYVIPKDEHITIDVFNFKGQKVITLVDEMRPAGKNSVVWNGVDANNKSVASGMYFYKFQGRTYTSTKKMILLK